MPIELSERISLLRLPLIIGVVFVHTYDPMIGRSTHLQYVGGVKFLVNCISEGLGTLSVPLFFLLAGYLFFYGFEPSAAEFCRKIVNRGRTLLIPLVFWNMVCLVLTAAAQANSVTAPYFLGRSTPIASFEALDYLNAIIGVTSHPIAYQFWFIRDLMVLAVLSPVIYFLLNKVPVLFLLLLGLRWFSASTALTIPFLSREAALFFCVGSALALRRVDLSKIDKWIPIALAYLPLPILDALTKESPINNPIHKTAELFGIALVFCATRHLWKAPVFKERLIALSPSSFFVFASHEPLLTAVRKLSYAFWPPSSSVRLVIWYFADPLLVVAICIATYFVCLKILPSFIGLVTGGRLRASVRQDASEAQAPQGSLDDRAAQPVGRRRAPIVRIPATPSPVCYSILPSFSFFSRA
jgi:surface polysaccharide O-acyltransferase-like enzyme